MDFVCCFIDLSNLASVTGRLAARCISFLSACASMECGVVRLYSEDALVGLSWRAFLHGSRRPKRCHYYFYTLTVCNQ